MMNDSTVAHQGKNQQQDDRQSESKKSCDTVSSLISNTWECYDNFNFVPNVISVIFDQQRSNRFYFDIGDKFLIRKNVILAV